MPSTYYVSTSGSNSNSGTSSSPFNTIPYAITQASNSDTIIVISGTYTYGTTTSNNVININKELTIIGRETITETRPIINISTASQNTAVLCNASNITLKGLEFVHNPVTTGSNDTCINLAPGGTGISPDSGVMVNENINILDCKIHFTKFGLSSKAKYFSVKNCELVSKVVTTARSIAIYSQDGIVDILNNTFTSSVSNNGIELLHNNFATNDSYQNKRNGTVNFIGNITVGINITRRAIFFEAGTDTGLSSDRYSFNVSNNTISTRSDCMMLLQPNSNFLNFINLITLNNNTYNNNLSTSNNGLVKVDQTYAPNKGPLTTPINNPKFLIYSNTINNATLNLSASSYNVDDKNVLIFIGFSPDSTGGLATSVINSILNTLDPNVADPQPAPVITSITTSSQTATINFTQGSNTGASAITSYQYSTNGGSTWVTALETSTPIVVTGLTNGTTYSFIIRNNNSLYSDNSNTISATINYPQPAPVITSITTSSQTATINFTQGSNTGASAITSYQYSTNGGSTWVTALETSTPIVVTGLTNGTTYSFIIRNNNSLYSEASNIVNATILSIPQPAPVITSITTSSQTATINFTQTTIVASAILSYQYSTNGGSDWVTALQTSSPIIVTGLTNGTRYNFVIRNNNGLYSEASNTFEATVDTVSTAELRGTGELTPDFINSIIGITSSFVIQKGFTSISENTFAACVGDVNITLPSSVTNIGSTNIQGDGIKIERTNGIPEWRNNSSSRPTQLFSNTGSLITANTLFA